MNDHSYFGGSIMKIIDEIFQITVPTPYAVGDVHMYLLKGDTLSLIDAGIKTDEAWQAFKYRLKEIGYEPKDIEQIILTHHHPDHTGLVELFDSLDGVYGHPHVDTWLKRDPDYLKRYEAFFLDLYNKSGVSHEHSNFLSALKKSMSLSSKGELTGFINEGDLLPGHRQWSVIETLGHSQSHLSFYREQDGAFLAGDHLLSHISPNPLLEPPVKAGDSRPKPLPQYRASLQKCLDLKIQTVYPGHGDVFGQVNEHIQERIEKQERRAQKVLGILSQKVMTPYEVCLKLFPKHIVDAQFGLTMSETYGQLDYLEESGKVNKELVDGVFHYQAVS